jgi:hypothetical protein
MALTFKQVLIAFSTFEGMCAMRTKELTQPRTANSFAEYAPDRRWAMSEMPAATTSPGV